MSPATASPNELADLRDVLDDDDAPETVPDADPTDCAALEHFVQAVGGETLGNAEDWRRLIGVNPGAMMDAEREGDLPLSFRHADRSQRGHGPTVQGYSAAHVLCWVKKHNIAHRLSDVARAMLDATPIECVDAAALYTTDDASRLFGVPLDTIERAVLAGEIRSAADPKVWASTARIEGGQLAAWFERNRVKPRPAIHVAAQVARNRYQAGLSRPSEPAGKPPSVIGDALGRLQERRNEERDAESANCAAMLAAYRQILARRHEPEKGDAELLAEVADTLSLSLNQISADAAALDRAAELETLIAGTDSACAELTAAGKDFKETDQRHKRELADAKRRLIAARAAHTAAIRSPNELNSLKSQHAELFGC